MDIKEGFICPHCMKMFDSVNSVKEHFSLCHIDKSSILHEKNGLKGILKKAKQTFKDVLDTKNSDFFLPGSEISNNPFEINEPHRSYAFYEEPNIKPQPSGVNIDRSDEFITFRRLKMRNAAIETSNLIMRIEKLLLFSTSRSSLERRNFEQSLVEWIEDDLVPMCPSCGIKFGFNLSILSNPDNPIVLSSKDDKCLQTAKRSKFKTTMSTLMNFEIEGSGPFIKKKHHCRLCGGIICSDCSSMFPSTEANRLISSINSRLELRESLWEGSGSLTWKEDSETSLDSIKSKMKQKEYCIRCCGHCKMQIESKWSQMEQRLLEPDVVVLYKELRAEINQTSDLIDEFKRMSHSLSSGSTEYSYHKASQVRAEIVHRCQQIDVLGNRFKSKNSISGCAKEATLFNAIYRSAYLFLQNNFATLQYLPSEEELKKIAEMKLKKIRDEVKEYKNKTSNVQVPHATKTQPQDVGWAPSITSNGAPTSNGKQSNPFEVEEENTELSNVAMQMDNVRRFIDQAREAKRFKDVEILQKNMVDLEKEYEIIQKKLYV